MASIPNPIHLLSLSLLCFSLISPSLNTTTISQYNSLIYNHCKNQTPIDPNRPLPQTLLTLFHDLIDHSSKSKFFETIVGDEKTSLSGQFQCREDLSNSDCHSCVSEIPKMSNDLCGETIPSRVQLSGCYVHYEDDDGSGGSVSNIDPLHKKCSEAKAASGEFERVRDSAFAELEGSVVDGERFCDINYEYMHVVAQCEGNLGICDCVECVNSAVHIAVDECGYSLSGEVYMHSCFVSYTYYPNGIPTKSHGEKGGGNTSPKLVAIVLGGLATLVIGAAVFYAIKSCGKKREDYW